MAAWGAAPEIESKLSPVEHVAIHAIATDSLAVEAALADARLTPISTATISLWGKGAFGEAWFQDVRGSLSSGRWIA